MENILLVRFVPRGKIILSVDLLVFLTGNFQTLIQTTVCKPFYSNRQKYLHTLLTRSRRNDEIRKSSIGMPTKISKFYYMLHLYNNPLQKILMLYYVDFVYYMRGVICI